MKKIVSAAVTIFLLTVSIVIPTSSTAAPDITKYAWPPSYTTNSFGQPLLGYSFTLVDDFMQSNTGEAFSFIRTNMSQRWCKDFKDPQCVKELESGSNFWTNQVLPPCETANDLINCVEAVNVIDADGNREKLVMEKLIPGNTWPADTSIRVEAGSSSSRWISASNSNSEKGLKVTVSGGLSLTMSSRSTVSSARLASFQASIEPYEKVIGSYTPPYVFDSPSGFRSFGGNTPNYCIWVDTNECGVQTEFAEAKKIELVLHIPTEISGWLLGRVDQPTFRSQRLGISRITGQDLSRITISANPVKIPLFSTKVDLANASNELNSHFQENKFCKERLPQCAGYFGGNLAGSNFDFTYDLFQLFEKNFNETANIVVPRWSIRSLSKIDRMYNNCKSIATVPINGIVTTNASIYQGSPPTFENDSFVYKVAGLHYLPNKEKFQGSYDLVLKSEFARCLYGFSNAPLKASVEVTNSDGVNRILTSTFTEKDGWINVSIKGFTFSQPTIKLKLSQEKVIATPSPVPTISPSPSPTPSTIALKKTTISCLKGKASKTVTAVKPKCPVGYKKK